MANFNLNKVTLGGRLTADPELRQTTTGTPVVSFTIACNRKFAPKTENGERGERQADFFTCVAWRVQAEQIARFFRKGSSICVLGSIQNRSWVDAQGVKKYATDIIVEEFYFVDSVAESKGAGQGAGSPLYGTMPYQGGTPAAPGGQGYNETKYDEPPKFEEMVNDDDLPF